MITYEFKGLDGRIHEIRAPAGTTPQQAYEALQSRIMTPQHEEGVSGFMRGLRDPLDAGAQMLERVLPEGAVQGINRLNNWLVDQGLPLQRLDERGLGGQLEDLDAAYREPNGYDWMRLLGNMVGGVAGGAVAGPSMAATTAGRIGGGIVGGAGAGALSEPVAPEDTGEFWQEKAKQAAWGAGGGAVGGAIGRALGRAGEAARGPDIERLRAMGVEPTVGQTLGDAASRAEEKAMSAPFLGGAVRQARERALEQFNKAAIDEALAPIGVRVGASGHEGIEQANKAVSRAYEDAAAMSKGVLLDDQATAELATLRQMLGGAPEQVERDFNRFYENVFQRRLGGAVGFEPTTFKSLESDISKRIKANTGELQNAYREAQRIMRAAAARQDPEYSAALSAANAAYARMRRITEAGKRGKLKEGMFTPGQLIGAAMMQDATVGKRATGEGSALMQDLGRLGQRVLGDVVPNSGTADRLLPWLGGGGLGAAIADPAMLASMAASGIGLGIANLGARAGPQAAMNAALRSIPSGKMGQFPGILPGILGTALGEELF